MDIWKVSWLIALVRSELVGWILVDNILWLASVNLKFTSIQCADNVCWVADLLKNYLDYFCRFSVEKVEEKSI